MSADSAGGGSVEVKVDSRAGLAAAAHPHGKDLDLLLARLKSVIAPFPLSSVTLDMLPALFDDHAKARGLSFSASERALVSSHFDQQCSLNRGIGM